MKISHILYFLFYVVTFTYGTSRDLQQISFPATLDIKSENGRLTYNSQIIHLKGVNYFGFESDIHTVHGLWAQSLLQILDLLEQNNFNSIRLPFSLDMIVNLNTTFPNGIDYSKNPNLIGMSSIQVMDTVIKACAARCITVLLDYHLFTGGSQISELWYNNDYPESTVISAWTTIISRYLDQWNVIGVDLKNENHGIASWGDNNPDTDWRLAAGRIGNAILSVNPKLLIFVGGVQDNNFPINTPENEWGSGLSSAAVNPVLLTISQKLVYSPHVYGPDVVKLSYFNSPDFPNNMPDVWFNQWGYLSKNYTVVIGEFGGKEIEGTLDRIWSDEIKSWFISNGITNNYFWSLNPNSVDTGGLLGDDWATPNPYKLDILSQINPNPTDFCQLYKETASDVTTNVNTPTPQVPKSSRQLNKNLKLTINYSTVSSWYNNGQTFDLYNAIIINNSTSSLTSVLLQCNSTVVQYWNTNFNNFTNIFSLPDWITSNGGLPPFSNLSFGFISNGYVSLVPIFTNSNLKF